MTITNAQQDLLPFHPLADMFPLMEGEEFDALVADIKANGMVAPIITYEGKIIDGRNRYRACLALGLDMAVIAANATLDGDRFIKDPVAYVVSANIYRRHLNAEQKRDLIAKLLKAQPEKSDRQIGKMAMASKNTAKSVRNELEARGQIDHVETRTDTKGRKQPAKKSTKKADRKQPVPKPVKSDPRVISPELGERVGRFAHDLICVTAFSPSNSRTSSCCRASASGCRRT
jgi:ParB-like nuclease domain